MIVRRRKVISYILNKNFKGGKKEKGLKFLTKKIYELKLKYKIGRDLIIRKYVNRFKIFHKKKEIKNKFIKKEIVDYNLIYFKKRLKEGAVIEGLKMLFERFKIKKIKKKQGNKEIKVIKKIKGIKKNKGLAKIIEEIEKRKKESINDYDLLFKEYILGLKKAEKEKEVGVYRKSYKKKEYNRGQNKKYKKIKERIKEKNRNKRKRYLMNRSKYTSKFKLKFYNKKKYKFDEKFKNKKMKRYNNKYIKKYRKK
jgi:hypothetical protein